MNTARKINDNKVFLSALTETLIELGDFAYTYRSQNLERFNKGDRDFATKADYEVEELFRKLAPERFPGVSVVGEEQGGDLNLKQGVLFVDPIDGTVNFGNRVPDWGVILCYVTEDGPQVGGIMLPERGYLLTTAKGEGTFIARRLRVEDPFSAPERMLITPDTLPARAGVFGADIVNLQEGIQSKRLTALGQAFSGVRCLNSAASSTVAFFTDNHRGYFNATFKLCDAAVGVLATREAGGVAKPIWGDEFNWESVDQHAVLARSEADAEYVREVMKNLRG